MTALAVSELALIGYLVSERAKPPLVFTCGGFGVVGIWLRGQDLNL